MSVPEGKRGEGKFEVLVKARNLFTYTLQICCNTNVFDPKYQNALTNDIISEAKSIFMCVWTANGLRLDDELEKPRRKQLQKEACEHCNNLLALMQVAQQVFHLKTKRIEYWAENTIEVRNFIKSWIISDRKRG